MLNTPSEYLYNAEARLAKLRQDLISEGPDTQTSVLDAFNQTQRELTFIQETIASAPTRELALAKLRSPGSPCAPCVPDSQEVLRRKQEVATLLAELPEELWPTVAGHRRSLSQMLASLSTYPVDMKLAMLDGWARHCQEQRHLVKEVGISEEEYRKQYALWVGGMGPRPNPAFVIK